MDRKYSLSRGECHALGPASERPERAPGQPSRGPSPAHMYSGPSVIRLDFGLESPITRDVDIHMYTQRRCYSKIVRDL